MKKLLLLALIPMFTACGLVKFDKETYLCRGTEKTFYPVIHNLHYVAHDATRGYSDKKSTTFKLVVEHKALPFVTKNINIIVPETIFRSENDDAIYSEIHDTYLGHMKNYTDTRYYSASFDKGIGHLTFVESFYPKGNATNSTRLQADMVRTIDALCERK